ncbi:MAG: DUF1800 domain-containing protein [Caldilineaceae bacterium]|nr:DUF1800 domain-containing protein [Caldilineaceae bacterium]
MEITEIPSQIGDESKASHTPALSRRALLRGSGAVLLAAGAATVVDERVFAQEAASPPAMRSPQQAQIAASDAGLPNLPSAAVIAWGRMAFGATPGDWGAFQALGADDAARLTAYVDQQLNPGAIDDTACNTVLAAQGFTTLTKSLEQLWADHVLGEADRYLPAAEVEKATFLRALYSKRQLVEVLANYWHDHFNVYAWDYSIAPVFVHYDRDVIRKHLLGNFRQMLEAVAQSPATLYFLDNQSNSGDRPNENYARELFELHGMGAENYFGVRSTEDPAIKDEAGNRLGYVDSDVYGATTCFTGWRVDEETGRFAFDDSAHFPYAKIVLGKVIPEFQGIQDGKQVLDLLAFHPASARYICRRLCRRLVSDNPPESLVQAAADVFVANKDAADQLKKVVRTILLSPEFRNTWGEKIKRPFEYSVALMRALGANYIPEDPFFWSYDSIGQGLFGWRPPNGYPDDREAWSGTMPMLQRWRHCNWLFRWQIGGEGADAETYRLRPETQTPANLLTANALVDFWSRRILGQLLPANERQSIVDFMAMGYDPDTALPADKIADRLRHMVAQICLSPSFQWR